jgi:hypothetical protein
MKWKIALIFCFFSFCAHAQEESDRTKPPAPEYFLTTIPVRLALRDLNIGFAHRTSLKATIEARIGWVHGNKILHNVYEGMFTSTEMLYKGPSVYFQWNKWKVSAKGKHVYWELVAGYRYLWYTDQNMWMGGLGGSSYAESLTLSQWRNDVLVLFTKGMQTSKWSTFEISAGLRISYAHTNVVDTRFHLDPYGSQAYEDYKASTTKNLPYSEGFGICPIVRVTSRIGMFSW